MNERDPFSSEAVRGNPRGAIRLGVLAVVLSLAGCVSKAEYTTLLMRVDRLESERQSMGKELQEIRTRNADLRADTDRVQDEIRGIRGQVEDQSKPSARQESQLRGDYNEDLMAQILEVRNRVIDLEERLGGARHSDASVPSSSQSPAPTSGAGLGGTGASSAGMPQSPYGVPSTVQPPLDQVPPPPTGRSGYPSPGSGPSSQQGTPDQRFQAGYSDFQAGRYKESRESFLAYLQGKPEPDLADDAQYLVGETYYNERQYEYALVAYDRVIKSYPRSEKIPIAMLKQALCFINLQYTSDARVVLAKLVESYPATDEAKIARERLKELGGAGAARGTR